MVKDVVVRSTSQRYVSFFCEVLFIIQLNFDFSF